MTNHRKTYISAYQKWCLSYGQQTKGKTSLDILGAEPARLLGSPQTPIGRNFRRPSAFSAEPFTFIFPKKAFVHPPNLPSPVEAMSETVLRVSADTTAPHLTLIDAFQTTTCQRNVGKVRTSNHSRIEKRRRDKLNAYITEISDLVPGCSMQSPRLDKLTVLRLALQHIKKFLTANREWKSLSDVPKFFAQIDLEHLCESAVDGFCMAVLRDRGRIVHVSEGVRNYLSIRKDELMNHSIYDLLHPKDVQNFKRQIYFEPAASSRSDTNHLLGTDGRDISEADSSLPFSDPTAPSCEGQSNSGCARSFFCSFKKDANCLSSVPINSECISLPPAGPPTQEHLAQMTSAASHANYIPFHCTGFLQCFTVLCGDRNEQSQERNSNTSSVYLFFVARPLDALSRHILQERNADFEFVARLLVDGTVISADIWCACVIGLPSQDIVGTRYYNHVCSDDWQMPYVAHRSVLQSTKCHSCSYRLKTAKHGMVAVSAAWNSFTNPWTKEVQFITIKHTLWQSSAEASVRKPNGANPMDVTQSLLARLLSDSVKVENPV